MFTKAPISSLGKVLYHVMHENQTGAVLGRSIFSNSLLVRDLVEIADGEYNPCSIDLSMTIIPSSAWNETIYKVQENNDFGAKFIGFIRTCYSDISSRAIINNFLTDPVYPERGITQECHMSSLLCEIEANVVGAYIRNNLNFQGVTVTGVTEPPKISENADETTISFYGIWLNRTPF